MDQTLHQMVFRNLRCTCRSSTSQFAARPPRKSRFFARLIAVFLALGVPGLASPETCCCLPAVGLAGLGAADEEGRVKESTSP